MHDNDEGKLAAQIVREFLSYYRMDYTMSVYLPEVALQNSEEMPKDELYRRAGVKQPQSHESAAPLLVHLLRQLKNQPAQQEGKPAKQQEEMKLGGYSNFEEQKKQTKKKEEEEIQEDIVEDIEEDKNGNVLSKDEIEGLGASASLGVD